LPLPIDTPLSPVDDVRSQMRKRKPYPAIANSSWQTTFDTSSSAAIIITPVAPQSHLQRAEVFVGE
jgi:hypothetical protein